MTFIPYAKQTINQDDITAVSETLSSDFLTAGPRITEFESALCRLSEARYAVAAANGTAALHLASLVMLNKGDKVLTTPNSFLATSNSILYIDAIPVFIDITPDGNIDLDLCEQALETDPDIKAIYAVWFSGNPVNQEKLARLRKLYNILILEDCAHALGARQGTIGAGSCINSECSILSFHPVKHITTGEGGAVLCNSSTIYEKLLVLRSHGMVKTPDMLPWEYEMRELGFNYRITDIQCALGLLQLKKLSGFINRRHSIARHYDAAFQDDALIRPLYQFTSDSSYHLYVVRVDFNQCKLTKMELFVKMKERHIGIQLHYIPINKQPYYRALGYGKEDTPQMDQYYAEAFSLPMYPGLTENEQNYVIITLKQLIHGESEL